MIFANLAKVIFANNEGHKLNLLSKQTTRARRRKKNVLKRTIKLMMDMAE